MSRHPIEDLERWAADRKRRRADIQRKWDALQKLREDCSSSEDGEVGDLELCLPDRQSRGVKLTPIMARAVLDALASHLLKAEQQLDQEIAQEFQGHIGEMQAHMGLPTTLACPQ